TRVPDDLQDLLPGRLDTLQWKIRHFVMPWLVPLLGGLAVLALLILIGVRLVGIGRPSVVIADFGPGGDTPSLGPVLAASFRQQLAEPKGARSSLTIATGAIEPSSIPADVTTGLSLAIPMTQVLTSLFKWTTTRIVTVSGVLHPPGPR